MSKRKFLSLSSLAIGAPFAGFGRTMAGALNEITLDGVSFEWQHSDGQFIGTLAAPTDGWIAVGFNSRNGIAGTHFVISSVVEEPRRFEEHFAMPPNHPRISEFGWPETASMQSGSFSDGISTVTFQIPARRMAGSGISLAAGHRTHLMLAWSHEADFNHHSAWRRHVEVTL